MTNIRYGATHSLINSVSPGRCYSLTILTHIHDSVSEESSVSVSLCDNNSKSFLKVITFHCKIQPASSTIN